MKKIALIDTIFAAATVFSVGVMAGCDYCQPLLLASVIVLFIERWLSAANPNTQHKIFAS